MVTMVQRTESASRIRVALVIESGKIKPVWFEFEGTDKRSRERIFVKEICYTWAFMDGATKIISFAVYDGSNSYELALNTLNFTWRLKVAESSSR
jgi:hypothetical protein